MLSELLTRLRDTIFADNWEIQVFQVVFFLLQNIENPLQLWTVPEQGRFSYNFVVFAKGGIIYKFSLDLTAMEMISLGDLCWKLCSVCCSSSKCCIVKYSSEAAPMRLDNLHR